MRRQFVNLGPEPEDQPNDRCGVAAGTVLNLGALRISTRPVRADDAGGVTWEFRADVSKSDEFAVRAVLAAEPVEARTVNLWILEGYRVGDELRHWVFGARYEISEDGAGQWIAVRLSNEGPYENARLVLGWEPHRPIREADIGSPQPTFGCRYIAGGDNAWSDIIWPKPRTTSLAALESGTRFVRSRPQQHELILERGADNGVDVVEIAWTASLGGGSATDPTATYATAVRRRGCCLVPTLDSDWPEPSRIARRFVWSDRRPRGHLFRPDVAPTIPHLTWSHSASKVRPGAPPRGHIRLDFGPGKVSIDGNGLPLGALLLLPRRFSAPASAKASAWLDFLDTPGHWRVSGHGFRFDDGEMLQVVVKPLATDRSERGSEEDLVVPVGEGVTASWQHVREDSEGLSCALQVADDGKPTALRAVVVARKPFGVALVEQPVEGGEVLATFSRTQARWEFTTKTGELETWLPPQTVADPFYAFDQPPGPAAIAPGQLARATSDRTRNATAGGNGAPTADAEPGTADTPWNFTAHTGRRRDGAGILLRQLDAELLYRLDFRYRARRDEARLADSFAMSGVLPMAPVPGTEPNEWREEWISRVLDDRETFARRLSLLRVFALDAPSRHVLIGDGVPRDGAEDETSIPVSDFRHAIPAEFHELVKGRGLAKLTNGGLSALGGWGDLVVSFADGRVVVRCTVVMGRVEAYSVEIPGRVKDTGHLCRCALHYARQRPEGGGRADVHALREVEILLDQSCRHYDAEPTTLPQPIVAIAFQPADDDAGRWRIDDETFKLRTHVEDGYWRVPLRKEQGGSEQVTVAFESPPPQRVDLRRGPGSPTTTNAILHGIEWFEASVVLEHGPNPDLWPHVATVAGNAISQRPTVHLEVPACPVVDLARRAPGASFPGTLGTLWLSRFDTASDNAEQATHNLIAPLIADLQRMLADWSPVARGNVAPTEGLAHFARSYQPRADPFKDPTVSAARKAIYALIQQSGARLDYVWETLDQLRAQTTAAENLKERAQVFVEAARTAAAALDGISVPANVGLAQFSGSALRAVRATGVTSAVPRVEIEDGKIEFHYDGRGFAIRPPRDKSFTISLRAERLPLRLEKIPVSFDGSFLPAEQLDADAEFALLLWPGLASNQPEGLKRVRVSVDVDDTGRPNLRLNYRESLKEVTGPLTVKDPSFDAEFGLRSDGTETTLHGFARVEASAVVLREATTELVTLRDVVLRLDNSGKFDLSVGRISFNGLLDKINKRLSEATQGMVSLSTGWESNTLTLAVEIAKESIKGPGVEIINLYTRVAPSFRIQESKFDVGFELLVGREERPFGITYSNLGGQGWLAYRKLPDALGGQLRGSIGLLASIGFELGPVSGRAQVSLDFIVEGGTFRGRFAVSGRLSLLGIVEVGAELALDVDRSGTVSGRISLYARVLFFEVRIEEWIEGKSVEQITKSSDAPETSPALARVTVSPELAAFVEADARATNVDAYLAMVEGATC